MPISLRPPKPRQPNWKWHAWRRWPRAAWIDGHGRYALLCACRELTITLWPTREDAMRQPQMRGSDSIGWCGGACNPRSAVSNGLHVVCDIATATVGLGRVWNPRRFTRIS
jgi:hypothetical protein